jgi:hypothetical protein
MSVWTGSKGTLTRPLDVTKAERDANHDRIFGKKITWLQQKKINEEWTLWHR